MKKVLAKTESLCPVCLCRIPAKRVAENGDVYLEKDCPEHGNFKALIWRNAEHYQDWGQYSQKAVGPGKRLTDTVRGCPYDCGLCPSHEADTCTTVMEVTRRCNLDCPVCFASGNEGLHFEPDSKVIQEMYQTIIEAGGPYPVQMSGGEPTLRDDLPAIVSLGKKLGFYHIQINTNGIRIAKDKEYLARLKENGADLIYLQFDGVSDDVYRAIRGRNLFDLKVQAISNCAEVKIGVVLVPTVVPNVNLHQLGDIVQFAKKWIPTVKGIHFQPISYFGRYPQPPKHEDRVTLSDILDGLVVQTKGELKKTDFVPRRCEDSHCSFSSYFVLMEDGKLQARTDIAREAVSGFGYRKDPPAVTARRFINRRWRLANEEAGQTEKECSQCCGQNQDAWLRFLRREGLYYLTITGMPFQDVWTLDLHRLKRCCVHVVTNNKQLIPLCAFYVTSISGERLCQNLRSRGSYNINKNVEYKLGNRKIDSIDLKALLVGRGVRISSRVYSTFEGKARLSPDPLQCNAVILPDNTVVQLTDLAFHLKYLSSSLSFSSIQNIKYVFQMRTPFKLNVDEFDRAAIFHKKQKITNVTFPRHTDFYKQTTSSGLPYIGHAVLQGTEWLSFYMLWPCDYACAGEPCQYCYPGGELATLTKRKKRLPRYPTPEDVAEIVEYAVTNNLANSVQITGGSTFNVQAECGKIKAILDAINKRVGRHSISGEIIVYTTPPADPHLLDQLFEAGANRVACSLEIWDEELAKAVMPGKMKFTGRKRHLAALEYIASKYGPNKACSNFVIGIEPITSLLAGAEYLASGGIVPIASVWIPFGRPVLNKMKAPGLEYYQAVKRGFSEIYRKYGIEPPGGSGLNVCICRDIWLQNNKTA